MQLFWHAVAMWPEWFWCDLLLLAENVLKTATIHNVGILFWQRDTEGFFDESGKFVLRKEMGCCLYMMLSCIFGRHYSWEWGSTIVHHTHYHEFHDIILLLRLLLWCVVVPKPFLSHALFLFLLEFSSCNLDLQISVFMKISLTK